MADYTPSVDDVGMLLAFRTVQGGGGEAGTFTEDTRPTAVQVSELCQASAASLALTLGVDVPDALAGEAQRLAALLTAATVETSFYSDADSIARKTYAAEYLAGAASLLELLHAGAVRLA